MDASDIQDILECVRLSEISPELLEGIVKPSGVYSMEDIQKALKEAAGTTESVETSIVKMPRGKFGMCGCQGCRTEHWRGPILLGHLLSIFLFDIQKIY